MLQMNIICIHRSLQTLLLTDPKNLKFTREQTKTGWKIWSKQSLEPPLRHFSDLREARGKILRSPSSKYYRILFLQINETEKGGAMSIFAALRAITALSASRFPAHHMMINPFGNQSTSLVKRRLRMMNTIKRRAGIEC
jgi:hypothetical protein